MAARGAVIVISHVSFAEKEITVGDNRNLNVSLNLTGKELDEVVVIGYGTQKKKRCYGFNGISKRRNTERDQSS